MTEAVGIAILVGVVLLNAISFFRARENQDRLYQATATDTKFNKR